MATEGGQPAGAGPEAAPKLDLESFQGPLDLLLHLIRKNEISITDIPIFEICRQYDEYLILMRELNLDVAGEYLVMAATLAHIKSRMLLPAPPLVEGEEPEDPRADLVRQLVEYQRAKAAAEVLRDRDEAEGLSFVRGHGGEDPLDAYRDEALLDVSLFELITAFRGMIQNMEDSTPLHVHREEISVADKISWILDRLEGTAAVRFQSLIAELPSRAERIVAFLAILELLRLRLITAAQSRPLGEIVISRAPASEEEPEDMAQEPEE